MKGEGVVGFRSKPGRNSNFIGQNFPQSEILSGTSLTFPQITSSCACVCSPFLTPPPLNHSEDISTTHLQLCLCSPLLPRPCQAPGEVHVQHLPHLGQLTHLLHDTYSETHFLTFFHRLQTFWQKFDLSEAVMVFWISLPPPICSSMWGRDTYCETLFVTFSITLNLT